MNLANLKHVDGADNMGGLRQRIQYCLLDDILTFPTTDLVPSDGAGNFAMLVTISANIVMKPYKPMHEIYATLETGGLESKGQGEFDGMSFSNNLKFFHPGLKAEILGFQQFAKNADLVFLVTEVDGTVRVLGHPAYPARMLADTGSNTGNKPEDKRGTEFSFKSARSGPAPIFTGKIDLTGSGYTSSDPEDFQDLIYAP